MLDRRTVGDAIEQTGDISHVADGLELLLAFEFFDQRNDVDRPGGLGQIHHARVEAAMSVDGKVFRLQALGGVIVSMIVEQNSA